MEIKKNKKYIFLLLKLLVVSFSCWYLYNEIFLNKNFSDIKNALCGVFNSKKNILYFSVAFLLIFFNWGIEALKWKFLIKKIEKIEFLRALFAIFSGITVSVFTPNRVGEYFGRIVFLKSGNKLHAVLLTVLGSVSQLLITIICGSVALVFFLWNYPQNFLNHYVFAFLVVLVILTCIFSTALFVSTPAFIALVNKFQWLNRFKRYYEIFLFYSSSELFWVLCLSFFRYIIFSAQFFLLLKIFGVEIMLYEAAILVPLIFFAVTVIPTITPAEIGVREFFALQFIGIISDNSLGIVSSAFAIWLMNLAFPAAMGAICIVVKKI